MLSPTCDGACVCVLPCCSRSLRTGLSGSKGLKAKATGQKLESRASQYSLQGSLFCCIRTRAVPAGQIGRGRGSGGLQLLASSPHFSAEKVSVTDCRFQGASLGRTQQLSECLQLPQFGRRQIPICGCQKFWKKLPQQAVHLCPVREDLGPSPRSWSRWRSYFK